MLTYIVSAIWYGPLFGKLWAKLIGMGHLSREEVKAVNRGMWLSYVIQFIVALIMNIAIYLAVVGTGYNWFYVGFMMWFFMVMPLQVGESLWSGLELKMKLNKLALTVACQLLIMLVAAFLFSL